MCVGSNMYKAKHLALVLTPVETAEAEGELPSYRSAPHLQILPTLTGTWLSAWRSRSVAFSSILITGPQSLTFAARPPRTLPYASLRFPTLPFSGPDRS